MKRALLEDSEELQPYFPTIIQSICPPTFFLFEGFVG